MNKLILLLLIPFVMMAQDGDVKSLFSISDTIFQTGTSDTIQFRYWIGDQASDWYDCDSTITTAEKVAEENEFIPMSKHSSWYGAQYLQIRIYNTADTIVSNRFEMMDMQGAVSIILVPDSINTDTLLYNNSLIWGN